MSGKIVQSTLFWVALNGFCRFYNTKIIFFVINHQKAILSYLNVFLRHVYIFQLFWNFYHPVIPECNINPFPIPINELHISNATKAASISVLLLYLRLLQSFYIIVNNIGRFFRQTNRSC